jgi:hypothetical protein
MTYYVQILCTEDLPSMNLIFHIVAILVAVVLQSMRNITYMH